MPTNDQDDDSNAGECYNAIRIIGPAERIAEVTYLASLPAFGGIDHARKAVVAFPRSTLCSRGLSPFNALQGNHLVPWGAVNLNSIVPLPYPGRTGWDYWDTAHEASETSFKVARSPATYAPFVYCDWRFDTRWSGPEAVMLALSNRFQDIGIRHTSTYASRRQIDFRMFFQGEPNRTEHDPTFGEEFGMVETDRESLRITRRTETGLEFEIRAKLRPLLSARFGPWSRWDGRVWPQSIREMNAGGPDRLAAGLNALDQLEDSAVDRFLGELRQGSKFGVVDAVLMSPIERDRPARLDLARVMRLAALCAADDRLARVVGSENGRLINGLHAAAYLARAVEPDTIEARGVRNVFSHASFSLDGRFVELLSAEEVDDTKVCPADEVSSALTTGALIASGNPDAWRFLLREVAACQVTADMIIRSVLVDKSDLAAAVDFFGASVVMAETTKAMVSEETKAKIQVLVDAERLLSAVSVATGDCAKCRPEAAVVRDSGRRTPS